MPVDFQYHVISLAAWARLGPLGPVWGIRPSADLAKFAVGELKYALAKKVRCAPWNEFPLACTADIRPE